MSKRSYTKPPLIYVDQLELLKSRGLIVTNDLKALHLLQQLSYYRLSGYWYTLLEEPKTDHIFKEGSTFEQAFKLYCFDRELRLLFLNQIEKIEVAVRAIVAYECSHSWGPFWLNEKTNFRQRGKYYSTLEKIQGEVDRSNELFLKEYKQKYKENLPPSWITLEVCSFGNLSWIFSLIKFGRTKQNIADRFGLNEKVFQSWLHSFVYVRNICAHHSRLWNKNLAIKPELPLKTKGDWINNFTIIDSRTQEKKSIRNKTYFVICMLDYMLQTINPNNSFQEKLEDLFEKYPDVDRYALGYTKDWDSEPMFR